MRLLAQLRTWWERPRSEDEIDAYLVRSTYEGGGTVLVVGETSAVAYRRETVASNDDNATHDGTGAAVLGAEAGSEA